MCGSACLLFFRQCWVRALWLCFCFRIWLLILCCICTVRLCVVNWLGRLLRSLLASMLVCLLMMQRFLMLSLLPKLNEFEDLDLCLDPDVPRTK
ncbi:hypothetical protein ACSBR1_006382 [Camellia fascicularis]